eukprot:m.251721 g.251721  ORF g.251721 m.251721 type:complete len:67 (-) comp15459_c0_seq1:1444-1644(-)
MRLGADRVSHKDAKRTRKLPVLFRHRRLVYTAQSKRINGSSTKPLSASMCMFAFLCTYLCLYVFVV